METEIFASKDHREFLKNFLSGRKNNQSLRAIARRAGFKSPGYLSMLIKGERKLTPRSADLLAKAMALKGKKRNLLLAFARLDSGRTEKEKQIAREEILRLKSHRPEFKLGSKQYAFLATWYYPVLFAVLENLPRAVGAEELALAIGRGVTVSAIEKALQDLQFIGLIVQNEEKQWKPIHAAVSTPDEVRDLAIKQYHRNMLELAEEALELPLEKREFNGLTVCVPKRVLPQVKEKIRRFRTELNEMLAQEVEPGEVYQLNLQFFPVTNGLERIQK